LTKSKIFAGRDYFMGRTCQENTTTFAEVFAANDISY